MDSDARARRLMPTFLEELIDVTRALSRDALALEKGPPPERRAELLRELFRTAHSLKGAAAAVNVVPIAAACHSLEEILAAARDRQAPLGADVCALLLATVDAVEEAGMRLREQQPLTGSPLEALLPRLKEAAASVSPLPRRGETPAETETRRRETKTALSPPAPLAQRGRGEEEGHAASVRVSAAKLDAFLVRSGELLVARRRVQARAAEVAALHDAVARWKADWRGVEKPLADLLGEDGEAAPADGAAALPRRAARAVAGVGGRLRDLERELDRLSLAMTADARALEGSAGALDDEVRRVRMLPFAEACQGLDRLVRDLAHAAGKEVELAVEGGAVELDRSVLEALRDPLRHLVRNAVDHAAETPAERRAAGKPPATRVTVSAAIRGGQVEVVVEDDGRGLDLGALREQVRRRGLPEPADERELAHAVFLPGLSTRRAVTEVSGRGVGLDVVKGRVEALHGSVDVAGTSGRGTRFTLAVPLTLTALRALLVTAGGQAFAVVAGAVQRLVRVDPATLRSVEGREVLTLGGPPLPLTSLAATLGLPAHAPAPGERLPAVVLAVGERRVAFLVDELLAEQEVVIKGLGARVRRLRHVSAATVLASGRVALVLNVGELIRTALAGRGPAARAAPEARATPARRRVLVVDDSVTTRALEKSILEAAGYEVLAAPDGAAAWRLLQERGADLIVSDVEMPRLDGFGLTAAVRGSKRFKDLPVVLVTARESEQDRARGAEVGADVYLGKSAFDQEGLLKVLGQLLGTGAQAGPASEEEHGRHG
jgi:two-component system chemotaxis sensor kinase CheA